MKKNILFIFIIIICLFLLIGCVKAARTKKKIKLYENNFHINLPEKYACLFYESITSIDSEECYIVLKIEEDYELEYENQFFTDYSNYETINIFEKIQLAKYYFQNLINKDDEKFFVTELKDYDWYGYEYKHVSSGRVTSVRYCDLYILHNKSEDILYIFYDKHQYPF